ncbi:septum-promoting GTP-binding protein 1-like [Impatiens glandulifera]|uniref:septum-promoting GTP-binding protein 1-like n=1 Tax=Impatiens glandulifera TaxID=253017 RepID=UPI001FB19F24|nr:septum-promoting GTP-binding protein 1-like [Impatiens glandulifera]
MSPRLSRKMFRLTVRRKVLRRVVALRHCFRAFWKQILACTFHKSDRYKELPDRNSSFPPPSISSSSNKCHVVSTDPCLNDPQRNSSDLVSLKITILGDPRIGKTSFMNKYVGIESNEGENSNNGLFQMDKTLSVKGARIAYTIWEVDGDDLGSRYYIPKACQDSVAILFMFDLTSRCTLNSVIKWYQEARKWNQTAIPVLIGTKFDEFVQLPMDLQWTIASEARSYAKAMKATVFFSSATYNINVNKIFKFITAKIFDVPWKMDRNLTVGEPIIDF